MIYFIQQGNLKGPIKIGLSRYPKKRFRALQTANPQLLSLLLTHVGEERTEKYLHIAFDKYRLTGEWFDSGKELLDYIESIKNFPNYLNKAFKEEISLIDKEKSIRTPLRIMKILKTLDYNIQELNPALKKIFKYETKRRQKYDIAHLNLIVDSIIPNYSEIIDELYFAPDGSIQIKE